MLCGLVLCSVRGGLWCGMVWFCVVWCMGSVLFCMSGKVTLHTMRTQVYNHNEKTQPAGTLHDGNNTETPHAHTGHKHIIGLPVWCMGWCTLMCCAVVWYGVVLRGVVWYCAVRCGVIWCGVVKCGEMWFGVL